MRPSTYYIVFAALVGLTALTVGASLLQLGSWHTPVGMGIAALKAVLVGLFFMHLIQSNRMVWIFLGAGLFWCGILFVLTLTDYWSRSELTF